MNVVDQNINSDNSYSFRNSFNTEKPLKEDNESYQLVIKPNFEGEVSANLFQNQSNQKYELNLENSNFLMNNKVEKEPKNQNEIIANLSNEKMDQFENFVETPGKKNKQYFQFSTQKRMEIETPTFNRTNGGIERDVNPVLNSNFPKNMFHDKTENSKAQEIGVSTSHNVFTVRNPIWNEPQDIKTNQFGTLKNQNGVNLIQHADDIAKINTIKTENIVKTNDFCPLTSHQHALPENAIFLPANVYINNPNPVRSEKVISVNPIQTELIHSNRYHSPTITRREGTSSDFKSMIFVNHPMDSFSPNWNTKNTEHAVAENNSLNQKNNSFLSIRKSNMQESNSQIQKEIYLSPANYKNLQTQQKTANTIFEENNDPQMYNYEILNTGTQSRKYIFKRNSSQSVLRPTVRNSGIESRSNFGSERISGLFDANEGCETMNEKYLSDRYGRVKLRVDTANYQVYRKVENYGSELIDVDNRSKSMTILRPKQHDAIRPSVFCALIE